MMESNETLASQLCVSSVHISSEELYQTAAPAMEKAINNGGFILYCSIYAIVPLQTAKYQVC